MQHQDLERQAELCQQSPGRKVMQRQGLGRMAVTWQVRKEIARHQHFERLAELYQQRQVIEQLVLICQVPQRQAESCQLWLVIMQPVQRIARKEQHLDWLDFER